MRNTPIQRVIHWLSVRLPRGPLSRLTPQESKALLVVIALFALGAAVRWIRLL